MSFTVKKASANSDEIKFLSDELHHELEVMYGKEIIEEFEEENKQMLTFYAVYDETGNAVACGALKHFNETTAEIKRMYVKKDSRGLGISKSLLTLLEQHARELHYQRLILETGLKQPEAMTLYRTFGNTPIKCYGKHSADPDGRCFEKSIS